MNYTENFYWIKHRKGRGRNLYNTPLFLYIRDYLQLMIKSGQIWAVIMPTYMYTLYIYEDVQSYPERIWYTDQHIRVHLRYISPYTLLIIIVFSWTISEIYDTLLHALLLFFNEYWIDKIAYSLFIVGKFWRLMRALWSEVHTNMRNEKVAKSLT